MNARSILCGIVIVFLITLNGAVRLYVAIPLMTNAPFTSEELDVAYAQLDLDVPAGAGSNATPTRFLPAGEHALEAPQTGGVTNAPCGVTTRYKLGQKPESR